MNNMKLTTKNGVTYINVTPHDCNFRSPATGEEFVVEKSGVVLGATPKETSAGQHPSGIKLVSTEFVSNQESVQALELILETYPNALIMGSIIAAQAFPGLVFSMVPCSPEYARVPPPQKRMHPHKFNVFPPNSSLEEKVDQLLRIIKAGGACEFRY